MTFDKYLKKIYSENQHLEDEGVDSKLEKIYKDGWNDGFDTANDHGWNDNSDFDVIQDNQCYEYFRKH